MIKLRSHHSAQGNHYDTFCVSLFITERTIHSLTVLLKFFFKCIVIIHTAGSRAGCYANYCSIKDDSW